MKNVNCYEASRLKGKRNKQENLCLQVTNTITKCFFRSGESLGAQKPVKVLVAQKIITFESSEDKKQNFKNISASGTGVPNASQY